MKVTLWSWENARDWIWNALKSLEYEKEIVISMPLQSGTQEMSEVLCH